MPHNQDSTPADDRAAKVRSAIDDWNKELVPDDRREKYDKIKSSAFVFYRGTNHLFWEDFAGDARLCQFGDESTRTWLQGDLHAENFGAFANDEGQVVYDVNDYDEAVIADYQYDLWRMAVSIVLVARQDTKLSHKDQGEVIDAFASSYLEQLRFYVESGGEDTMVFDASNTYGVLDNFLEKLRTKSSRAEMLDEWTQLVGDQRQFNLAGNAGKLAAVTDAESDGIRKGMQRYEQMLVKRPKHWHDHYFDVKDIARRLSAGTGSLGARRFYVLIAGAGKAPQNNRILDVKQQPGPTAYHFLSGDDQKEYQWFLHQFAGQNARWHEAAYRAMAKYTDDHLGWMELSDGFYSVRERSFFQEAFDTTGLKHAKFVKLAEQWGKVLATDHSRALSAFDYEYSGYGPIHFSPVYSRFKTQVIARTANRHDDFQALVREVAFSYAGQVEADWDAFRT